jgi:cell filamentation protein
MYDAAGDPYCYPGTSLLKNIPGLKTQAALDEFEAAMTAQRAEEPLPTGRLSASHYRAIHHHLFQDVFAWAGQYRTVRLSKEGSAFCYPQYIDREMKALFANFRNKQSLRGLARDSFAREAAAFLARLNAIHPFREGNGRTQLSFLSLVAYRASHPLLLDRLDPERFLSAMISSFRGNERPLHSELCTLIEE